MLNVKQIAEQAAGEFGLSLKDDPTAWADAATVTPAEVVRQCNEAARENARSALSRALGKVSELIATEMDVAVAEDGPLADLASVLAQHVEGLDVDLSGVEAAADWQARVDALREALALAVHGYLVPALRVSDVLAYANGDDRLHAPGLRKGIAAIPEADDVKRGANTTDVQAQAEAPADWDDEPAVTAEPAAPDWDDEPAPAATPARQRKAAEPSGPVPALVGLAVAAGITDTEMAGILGLSKSYYSLIRNGKRPWPGVKPDQAQALRAEVNARAEALAAVIAALDDGAVLRPDGA